MTYGKVCIVIQLALISGVCRMTLLPPGWDASPRGAGLPSPHIKIFQYPFIHLTQVVQNADNTISRINHAAKWEFVYHITVSEKTTINTAKPHVPPERNVAYPRTQHNISGHGLSPDHFTQRPPRYVVKYDKEMSCWSIEQYIIYALHATVLFFSLIK